MTHPGLAAFEMHPVPPPNWVSAPVDALRRKLTTALVPSDVAYTFRPSGLTATELGAARPIARAQPPVPPRAMHPAVPDRCRNEPFRLRA